MNIRKASVGEHETLIEIWLRSVRATHHFLSEADLQFYLPLVRERALPNLELWILETDAGEIIGFMGLDACKVEALFLAPEYLRQGGGRQLLQHARKLKGQLQVDVNEQNVDARRFYESQGFYVESRSATDSTGRPYPLLHMRQDIER